MFQDDDNFIEIGYWGREYKYNLNMSVTISRQPHFTKEFQGKRNILLGSKRGFGAVGSPETIFLKIERIGNQYNGYYSFVESAIPKNIDDIRWTNLGSQTWINLRSKLSFWADNSNDRISTNGGWRDSAEVAAEFAFILIRETS